MSPPVATLSKAAMYAVNDVVDAKWGGGTRWYMATVTAVHKPVLSSAETELFFGIPPGP